MMRHQTQPFLGGELVWGHLQQTNIIIFFFGNVTRTHSRMHAQSNLCVLLRNAGGDTGCKESKDIKESEKRRSPCYSSLSSISLRLLTHPAQQCGAHLPDCLLGPPQSLQTLQKVCRQTKQHKFLIDSQFPCYLVKRDSWAHSEADTLTHVQRTRK